MWDVIVEWYIVIERVKVLWDFEVGVREYDMMSFGYWFEDLDDLYFVRFYEEGWEGGGGI